MGIYSNRFLIGVFLAFQKKYIYMSVFFSFKFKINKKIFEKKKNQTNKRGEIMK